MQNPLLKRLEGGYAGLFGGMVARDLDIDDTARGDVLREEDRWEFDLRESDVNTAQRHLK